MSSNVLVTGGAGFIGSHLVRALLQQGAAVRILDDLSSGRRKNLDKIAGSIELIEGDIRDKATCAAACSRIDAVFHLAGLGSVPRSIEDPVTCHEINATGTLNLLLAARGAGIRRVVFSSSSSIYGDTPVLPKHEQMLPAPMSPYAVSKLAAEEYCRVFARTYGLETVVLRYFNVFGPRQDPKSQYAAVIPLFMAALQESRQPVLYGDGSQSRDFTYVENVVAANILAASVGGVSGEVFNIACGERITVMQVLTRIAALMGRSVSPRMEPERAGDILHSLADISSAQNRLGFEPRISFNDGLRKTVESYQAEPRSDV